MAPTRVVSYHLEKQLGRGATATVWLARTDHGRVALKLGRRLDVATALASEALHASLALSPRLPELLDAGTLRRRGKTAILEEGESSDLVPFIALGWREGASLEARLAEPADPHLALRLAAGIGEALADLHEVGLAHGDVKPSNVVLGSDGAISLIDLGLAGPHGARQPTGATPRYLGTGDRDLGDARARDLLALGIMLAEIADPAVRSSREPLAAARAARFDGPLGRIIGALLAPEPAARASARWVVETAGAARSAPPDERRDRWRRSVRATYLRLREIELGRAAAAESGVSSWAHDAIAMAERLRLLCRRCRAPLPPRLAERAQGSLAPLDLERRGRWLAALVGRAAIGWSLPVLDRVDERALGKALEALAAQRRPSSWTLTDVERALKSPGAVPRAEPAPASEPAGALDPARVARLALRVARLPLDEDAIEAVEGLGKDAPSELILAAADALRLAGQLGRARSLVLSVAAGGALAADILRRAGDLDRAREAAERALAEGADPSDRARATLARMELDAGALDRAEQLLVGRSSAACAEVAALLELARGNRARAIEHARRGQALAAGDEARARLAGTLAYVQHYTHPAEAREGFRRAVEHAERAGAVLEEASYRTGEAASCVDLGELTHAVATASRAAVLWEEVLGRPAMSARAWLARAAAYAALEAEAEAVHAAQLAIERAREGGDRLAEAWALWAIADAVRAGAEPGRHAIERAAALEPSGDDALQLAARQLCHGLLHPQRTEDIDRAAHDGDASVFARLAWWGARAHSLASSGAAGLDRRDAARVLAELVALADQRAPVVTRGKAMFAGIALADRAGDTQARSRIEAAHREAAAAVWAGSRGELEAAARACAWLGRAAEASASPLAVEQALDLGRLVKALSERDNLRALLDRVLDMLLLWTGAERGLLLLKTSEGALVPRAARNLSRSDLEGEQLTVSTSLARRALDRAEPVLAIDAMEELAHSIDSVHALQLRSVLVLPLIAHGDVLGVVYLDDRMRRGAFGERELTWTHTVAPIAALAIADARTQVRLRRAVERAERASERLEQALAKKETALDVAERELAKAVGGQATRFRYHDIIGESDAMQRVLALVDRVAQSDVPVLLCGDSGSGKELIARAIHRGSLRADKPFVGENCGALPETLLESALFGHVKGAFTGAHRPRVGLFEAADEGSLFLDEIGEMSLGMQTKLLRVLEDNLVRPVGSTRARKVDVRIIGATHRDLEQMVAEGSFREDLYYRLNVITIRIPPLRERASDIPLLAAHLIGKHAPGRGIKLTRAASERLMRYAWPGNVRQLENEIRRALLLADDVIDVHHLTIPDSTEEPDEALGLNVRARIDRLETSLVTEALERTGGNQTQAAKLLGISRYGLHKMMKRLGLRD